MQRTPTALDRLADGYFDALVASSPMLMTSLGLASRQDEFDDLAPAGVAAQAALAADTLAEVDALPVTDPVDAVTASALKERLSIINQQHLDHDDLMDISNIASGLHAIREAFDLMPQESDADWALIARRLLRVPEAVSGWLESQEAGIEAGVAPAIRQVDALVEQISGWIGPQGFFANLTSRAARQADDLSADTGDALAQGVLIASAAYAAASHQLKHQIRSQATAEDAIGQQRYALASREFVGSSVDLAQTYQWGLSQVAELEDQQRELCASLRPGLSVTDTKTSLDHDPLYLLHGTPAMQAWMQARANQVMFELNGRDFDIPAPIARIECLIAPTQDGGIYYTEPSDDFSRPGRMWWSVPAGQTTFSTWRELTTVHHEGVPGHHLQIGLAMCNRDQLNKWRRQGLWVSGHGEGWALYAEGLMSDLGYLDDAAMHLGLLDSMALRMVRVVIDIGLHCGFTAPDEVGGGDWTFDKALAYFNAHVMMDPQVARFEVLRYFGWPGQAPSYALGCRAWTEIRQAVKQHQGEAFSLRQFHADALAIGSVGLDTLRGALLG
ncbi:MAG: DUF885 domain-containing protein [Propionibacteriaceae bacterium]|jgi:uncharacterized protein (DUF885 family)|nr:DUF885 domain-containing protein [Propionibacteriaceae bacterium]